MAFDFDSYLKKKGITDSPSPKVSWAEPENKDVGKGYDFDSALDRIDSKAASEQGYSLPEYRDLQKKSEEAAARNKGIKREKGMGDYAEDVVRGVAEQPFLRSFSKGATAGLSEPVAAGISTLIRKGMGDDKGFGDVYRDVSGEQSADFKEGAAQHPIQNILGEIAGIGAPGGAFSRLYGAAGNATQLPLMMEGSKVPLGLKVAQAGLRGGLANLGFGAVDTAASNANLEGKDFAPVKDFLLGAAGDIISMPAEKAMRYITKPENLRNVAEGIPFVGKIAKGAREDAESEAKRLFENAKETYRAGETSRKMSAEADSIVNQREAVNKFKELINKDPEGAASEFHKVISKEDRNLSNSYDEMVGDLLRKHANTPYETTPIISEVDKVLQSLKVKDKSKLFSPEFKNVTNLLEEIKNGYGDEATLQEIDLLRQQLGEIAKFGKNPAERGKLEKIAGKLYDTTRDHLNDAYADLMGPEGAEQISNYKKNFSTKKPLIKKGQSLAKLDPERQVVGLRSKLPASRANPMIQQFPDLKEPIGDMFLNMLTQHSVAPRKFTKEIDYYGRDTLKKILGEEKFARLEGAEKNLHEAAIPWKKNYVPEAPPQLSESQMEEIYQTLAAWAQSPENIKKKLGAGSAPPIGSMMAPFSRRFLSNN